MGGWILLAITAGGVTKTREAVIGNEETFTRRLAAFRTQHRDASIVFMNEWELNEHLKLIARERNPLA